MGENKINFGGVNIGMSPATTEHRMQDSPFHTLVIADFCGANNNSKSTPTVIDRDNFDEVMARLQPKLTLSLTTGGTIPLTFSTLDDFHPDALYAQVTMFAELKRLRNRLSKNETFKAAAIEIGAYSETAVNVPITEGAPTDNALNVLDMALNATTEQNNEQQNPDNLANNIIKEIIAPYVSPAPNPKKDELIQTVDKTLSELMSSILHHAEFKKLESTWRALKLLVSRSATDANLKIFILPTKKDALLADFSQSNITDSKFYNAAFTPFINTPGAVPWANIIVDLAITPSLVDILLLDILSQLAASANASLLMQASAEFVGAKSLAETPDEEDWNQTLEQDVESSWDNLRSQSYSQHLGLCFPRFLLRLPYGKQTRPIESFSYEEMDIPKHSDFLWGNSAYAVALLLNQTFTQYGWNFKPGQIRDVERLPVFHFKDEWGDSIQKPISEALLTEKAIQAISSAGLIPVFTLAGSDQLRVGSMRSVCKNHALIHGRWLS